MLADELSGSFTAQDFAKARAVGDLAAVALHNARRFADLERGGLRERDSPAYNLSYSIDSAGKELYKAQRTAVSLRSPFASTTSPSFAGASTLRSWARGCGRW